MIPLDPTDEEVRRAKRAFYDKALTDWRDEERKWRAEETRYILEEIKSWRMFPPLKT